MAKIKLPKKGISTAARKRFRRTAGRRLAKNFGRRLMRGFGLGSVYDEQQEKSIRDFRRSMYGNLLKKKLDNVVDEPPLDAPETEGNVSNPDISALNEQLKKVLKTAKAMGLVDKQTQDLTMKQLREANRAAKENQLEAPIEPQAVPEPQEGTGNAISPLGDKLEDLIKAFEDLIDTVEDKKDRKTGGDRLADAFGLGDVRREYKSKGPRLKKGFTATPNKTGGISYRDASGKFTTPEKALERGYAKNQIVKEAKAARAARAGVKQTGVLSKLGGKIAATKPVAAAISKTAAVGGLAKGATSKITKGIKAGVGAGKGLAVKGAELTGQALKTAIIKVAGPKIGKAIASTGVKSIPILGTIAGLGFAAARLVDGDFVGAGLDAVSGLAGPVTAIPAMVASLSRDIYRDVFGIQPEVDPQFGERMTVVQSTVKGLVESQLGKKVQPKDQAAGQAPGKTAPAPQAVKQTGSAPSSQAPVNPPPVPAPSDASKPIDASKDTGSSASAPPASAPSVPATPPKVATGSSGSAPSPGATDGATTAPVVQNQPSLAAPKVESKAATAVPPATQTGAQIAAATDAAENAGTPRPKIGRGASAVRPATKATTKNGARGMGDVPEPTYLSMGNIAKQLYFNAGV